ncbi:hypothetical protein PHISCL_03899 [Aspergillus sclerotialis]|uniref:Rhodopsin domain-containing protein n=1 Tax=Aspergillus sclerotialis TaxID=2070753 RepID=A0A3A2ZKM5_9EURO|nr:hypothetical protein PHISCL_03899 [Aspergillus sclerotialis]
MATVNDVFGPPPPNIDLGENKTPKNNGAMIAVYTLAVIAVILRFVSRMKVQRTFLGPDDWVIAASVIPLTGLLVSSLVGGRYGLGKHVWSFTIEDVVNMRKDLFAYIFVYLPVLSIVKIGLVLFYRRIFRMNVMMWICLALSAGYPIGTIIAFLCAPRPPSYFWKQFIDPTGGSYAYDLYKFYIGNAAANVFIDVLIFIVPIPIVWKLQLKTFRKILVCSIFLLGVFATVASIVRIYYMTFLNTDPDITWIMGDVFVWSTIEPAMGILCACLPTLNPILQLVAKSVFGTAASRIFGSSYRASSKGHQLSGRQSKRHSFQQLREGNENMTTNVKGHSDDEVALTSMEANSESNYKHDTPFAIRVKHDFAWSEDHR